MQFLVHNVHHLGWGWGGGGVVEVTSNFMCLALGLFSFGGGSRQCPTLAQFRKCIILKFLDFVYFFCQGAVYHINPLTTPIIWH